MTLLDSALHLTEMGLSVIATDNAKTSLTSWKKYQQQLPTRDELVQMFTNRRAAGLAIVCGAVSGNLEVIDIDVKYGVQFQKWLDLLKMESERLASIVRIVQTRSGGYHIYYRCEVIEGNQKLAERFATDDEKYINPNVKQCVLIETRGEGGYVLAPPSDGYTVLQDVPIPVISLEDRDILLTISRSFNEVIEVIKQPTATGTTDKVSPADDYNQRGDIITILEKYGWSVVKRQSDKILLKRPGQTTSLTSAVYFTETRIFYPHTTSTNFENKGYNNFGVYTLLECGGNYKKAAKNLSEQGYGETQPDGWFWTYNRNGGVIIQRFELQRWLHDNYVQLYFHDAKTGVYRLITENEGKLEEIFPENIKKYVKTELMRYKHYDVLEQIIKQANSIFTDTFFEFIDKADVDILRDEIDKCYFPFANAIVRITSDKIEEVSYRSIGKSVWASQINDFKIRIIGDFDPKSSKYYEFIEKICSDDPERIKYALSIIGYILHSYKDPARPFAVILAEETDDEQKGGGTGKGLFFQAIGKLIPVVRIDGKNFRPDRNFAFQRVQLGTRLVIIEDCPRNVDFERYYPTITEGMTIEKKNQSEIFLKFDESPKIAFTTNYTINNTAEHAKRRQRVLEFSSFFSSKYTPLDHFKGRLFDWDEDEWVKFYNLMFYCVRVYLERGIAEMNNSEKLNRKQVKMQFGEEFLDHLDDLESGREYVMQTEWESFLKVNQMTVKDYSYKRYSKALKMGSQILKIGYMDYKSRQNGNLKHFRIDKSGNMTEKIDGVNEEKTECVTEKGAWEPIVTDF